MILMKRLPEKLPPMLARFLQELDLSGDDPVIFTREDVPPRSSAVASNLVKRKIVSEGFASSISCIDCDALAKVTRSGHKGEKFTAVCHVCGCSFRINQDDAWEWRMTWQGLSGWLSKEIGANDEPEIISANAYFLGHIMHAKQSFEIYLARACLDRAAAIQTYAAIGQAMTSAAVVLSLAANPTRASNPKITVISLRECLSYRSGKIGLSWPSRAFTGKDQIKQKAGMARIESDPARQQKEKLKTFVRMSIATKFADMYHSAIKAKILAEHHDLVSFKTINGSTKKLSDQMILDAVKEVMVEKGLDDWISGKKRKP